MPLVRRFWRGVAMTVSNFREHEVLAVVHGFEDRFGRHVVRDTRNFPARRLLRAMEDQGVETVTAEPRPTARWERLGRRYDQIGGTCVPHAGRAKLDASPFRTKRGLDPYALYPLCKAHDEWPGESYEGSSGLGLMGAFKELGYIDSYWQLRNAREVADAVLAGLGLVMLGSWWWSSMMDVPRGVPLLVRTPNARRVGGHETGIYGYSESRGVFGLANSWGYGWARDGLALMTGETLDSLLADDGDAFVGIEIKMARRLRQLGVVV